MRDEIEMLRDREIQPFGVNPAGIESHHKYVEKFGFPFPLLSDPDRTVAAQYRALKSDGRRIQRTVYLIDRSGAIRYGVQGSPPLHEMAEAIGE